MPLVNEGQGLQPQHLSLPLFSAQQGRALEPLPHESSITSQLAMTTQNQLLTATRHLDSVRRTGLGQMLLPQTQQQQQQQGNRLVCAARSSALHVYRSLCASALLSVPCRLQAMSSVSNMVSAKLPRQLGIVVQW